MKKILLFLIVSFCGASLMAQTKPITYTITADTTLLTGCDSNELIISNHTQNVPGFLFNTGNGRTQFRRGLVSLGSGSFQIGGDTLKLGSTAWLQGGNTFGTIGKFGTLDSNHVDFYTDNVFRGRITSNGHWILDTTADNGSRLQVNGVVTTTQDALIHGVTVGTGVGNVQNNTAIGYNALQGNPALGTSTALGYCAAQYSTGAVVALGFGAAGHSTGNGLIAIGWGAG